MDFSTLRFHLPYPPLISPLFYSLNKFRGSKGLTNFPRDHPEESQFDWAAFSSVKNPFTGIINICPTTIENKGKNSQSGQQLNLKN